MLLSLMWLWLVFVVGVCRGDCCLLLLWFLVAGRWSLVVVQKTVQTRCIYTSFDTTLGKKGEKTRGFLHFLIQLSTKKCKNTWFLSAFEKILDEN